LGFLDRFAGRTVYLDANTFIYAIEQIEEFAPVVADLMSAIDRGEIQAVTSELTLAETLVKPLREGNEELADDYAAAIQPRRALTVVPVSRDVLVAAARMRAETGLRLPDAIHGVTALQSSCTHFLTNDAGLRVLPGIEVVLLSEVVQRL
jgi:predicted nucleic acid-binding protein